MFKKNSILFKDLLISLSGNTGKNLIIGFSVIYFITFLLFLSGLKSDYSFENISRHGKSIFIGTGMVQLCVLMFIGYMKSLTAISSEKTNKTFSFIKISPIKSFDFVIGKFLSIFLYVFLLFVISLPFLSIGLILGGVNIFDVLIYILYSISYISFSILFGLLVSIISKKFSVVLGIGIVPILIFFIVMLFGVFPFGVFDFIQNSDSKNIVFSIFPLPIFDNIQDKEKYITLFGLNIHYILHHIIFYFSTLFFIFILLLKQYEKNKDLKVKTYYFFETGILFVIFLLLSPLSGNNIFYLIFIFFVTNFLFFIYNNNFFYKSKYIEIISYFGITLILGIIFIIVFNGFTVATILLYFSIFLLFFTSYFFLTKIIKNISNGIMNLYHFIFLILFFYILPLISTNLLEIKYSHLNDVLYSSFYEDGLLGKDYNCNYKNNTLSKEKKVNINYVKCPIINNTPFYKYIIFYILLSFILIGNGIFIGNRKK